MRYFPALQGSQVQALNKLPELYKAWNSQINVISRKDEDALAVHHVLHSLAIARVMGFRPGMRVLDIGTGGGFPAIPLAILFPQVQWVAVDSIGKKIKVVQDIAAQVGLNNLEAVHGRAEKVPGFFDFAVSRAVARMALLLEWSRGLISGVSLGPKANGWLVLKGGDLQGGLGEELRETGQPFEVYPVRDFFEDMFFDQKFVVYMGATHSFAKFIST
jgi:16S rRNA (guanine527-N7)-methyltransferase